MVFGLGSGMMFEAVRRGDIADVRSRLDRKPKLVHVFGKTGLTPLHMAVYKSHIEICKLLLANGADVNSRGKKKARQVTPLHCAKERCVAELLLRAGAEVNLKDWRGWTPLSMAARECDSADLCELLLEKGADIHLVDKLKRGPLHYAAALQDRSSAESTIGMLLTYTAPLNDKDEGGYTPLRWAAGKGRAGAAKALIEAEASVDLADKQGFTPLHAAAGKVCMDIFKGSNWIDWSGSGNYPEVVRLLVDAGANVNARDREGRTPLALANLRWRHVTQEVSAVLREHGAVE